MDTVSNQALYLVSTDTQAPTPAQNGKSSLQSDITMDDDGAREALAQLIQRIGGQDEIALEKLYLATVDTVFGLVSKILGTGPDAEEVTEDVYLYVWQNAQRYDPVQAHPTGWLIMLARSRAIDRYRHRAKHQRISEVAQQEAAIEISDDEPLTLLLETKLRHWLEALPQTPRQILTMAYFRGMTHAEIAEDLQMSLGTVKTHIRRTLLTLRAEVEA